MKITKLLTIIFILCLLCSSSFATELDEVYKHWGHFNVIVDYGLRIYYPDSIKEAMPRIVTSFSKVRKRVLENFPNEKDFVATVILDDHNDTVSSTTDSKFDFINLSITDEMDLLSARSYSLEKRFALSLAKTMVKHSTSNVSFTWRRSLAMLAIPYWFIEGMALNYAFTIDSIHYCRLLDMARNKRLYSLDDLNTISIQPTLIKEEMLFQAHSMLAYWESTYKKGADVELVTSIVRNLRGFENAFKKYYGVSLKEAYNSYVNFISKESLNFKSIVDPDFLDVDYIKNDAKIFRSYLRVSNNERIWLSSKRYTTENYDLYYRKGIEKPLILLKNVHPSLIYDSDNKEIIIGKYKVNSHKEKRLILMAVNLEGQKRCLVSEKGSFKPLGIKDNRIYYVNSKAGITKIMSIDKNGNEQPKIELDLGSTLRPLDLALDSIKERIFFTFQTVDFETHLAVIPLSAKDVKKESKLLISYDGDLRTLRFVDGKLWCSCDRDYSTTQLFYFDEEQNKLNKYSNIPGGVWDISFSDPEKKHIDITTLYKGGFSIASIPVKEESKEVMEVKPRIAIEDEELLEVKHSEYKTEYHDTLWKPLLGKDSDGNVLGIYNYRSDRLDRSGIMIAPTYGLKSNKWGYISSFMKRQDLLKATASFNDYTVLRDYLDTDYYERIRSKRLQFDYPLKLDMNISFGFDLIQRGISKIKKTRSHLVPTAGKDHYYFVEIAQKAIRTEPYNNIFPRKGRTVNFLYKRGVDDLFGGDMLYDSLSLHWNEYIPLNDYYVLTLNTWVAEDDKRNDIRRPDDLSIGGDNYLKAYSSSYKSGDKLRYASLNLARPVKIPFPKQISFLQNKFSTLGIFWEMGDTINRGKFDYDYDRGVEFASSLLLFKRLPISLKAGYAVKNGQKGHGTYCSFFMDDLTEIISQ